LLTGQPGVPGATEPVPWQIGNAAIHAARGLVAGFLFRQRQHEFAPRLHPLLDGEIVAIVSFDFEKPGDLAHVSRSLGGLHRGGLLGRQAP
jgi:hypothetical protein